MTDISRDLARIALFPPLIPAVTFAGALFLQCRYPLGILDGSSLGLRLSLGLVLCAPGMALLFSGVHELRRNGTNVRPTLPAVSLITSGVYAWTRNPIYVGGSAALLGFAAAAGLDWLFVLYVVSFLALHFGVVLPEERYLLRRFGDTYCRYRAGVPRYMNCRFENGLRPASNPSAASAERSAAAARHSKTTSCGTIPRARRGSR